MWSVKSESGRLRSVLVHSAGFAQWWKIPIPGTHPLTAYSTVKQTYPWEAAVAEHNRIMDFLLEEGVRVFELTRVLEEVLEGASVREREEIIRGGLGGGEEEAERRGIEGRTPHRWLPSLSGIR